MIPLLEKFPNVTPESCAKDFAIGKDSHGVLELRLIGEVAVFSSQMAKQIFEVSEYHIIDVRVDFSTFTFYRPL